VSDHPIHDLHDDVHQRVRLGILAALLGFKRADFAHLKQELALTDGNLGRHLEVLAEASLVTLIRDTKGTRPRTWVAITTAGRKALRREVAALRQIIEQIDNADATSARSDQRSTIPD
jgi:DNA-binding MarR family transcriptional regulator